MSDMTRREGALQEWWKKYKPDENYSIDILQAFHAGAEHEQDINTSNTRKEVVEEIREWCREQRQSCEDAGCVELVEIDEVLLLLDQLKKG